MQIHKPESLINNVERKIFNSDNVPIVSNVKSAQEYLVHT